MTLALTNRAHHATRALNLPDHPDLSVEVTDSRGWLYEATPTGGPADYTLEWVSRRPAEHAIRHDTAGTFDDLLAALAAAINAPDRLPDAPIELTLSEWALHYKLIGA